jgi:hypothetical protein
MRPQGAQGAQFQKLGATDEITWNHGPCNCRVMALKLNQYEIIYSSGLSFLDKDTHPKTYQRFDIIFLECNLYFQILTGVNRHVMVTQNICISKVSS